MPGQQQVVGKKLILFAMCGIGLLAGCGISALAVIPTLFNTQSQLAGCPTDWTDIGNTVEITYEILVDGQWQAPEPLEEITWSITSGDALLSATDANPITVELTQSGILTIRADYISTSLTANPATCDIFTRQPE
ncbi:MAG: hypothetical protein HJJLKODD_01161 [Phycisphaerae bacterium]|nr:hypothetical protein [Phycisphaerae bacterium]